MYMQFVNERRSGFISVFNRNYHAYVMPRFRYKPVLAGNDVMAFSPLGGAAGDLQMRIPEGRPYYISV